jgi:phosphoglycerol transferase
MTEALAPRARVLVAEGAAVGVLGVAIACVLLSVWRGHWSEPSVYDGDANFYSMVVRTIGRYGTYLHNPHLGWPFGQNLADMPQGADNAHWLVLTALQAATGSTAAAINIFYVLSFGTTAAAAHVVLRLVGVRRLIAAAAVVPKERT